MAVWSVGGWTWRGVGAVGDRMDERSVMRAVKVKVKSLNGCTVQCLGTNNSSEQICSTGESGRHSPAFCTVQLYKPEGLTVPVHLSSFDGLS